jgi:hypothetical protein
MEKPQFNADELYEKQKTVLVDSVLQIKTSQAPS